MQRRAGGIGQYSRGSSPVENGHSNHPVGGQLCPGGSACGGRSRGSSGGSYGGLGCGCTRKPSPLRRAINKLRFRARRAASGSQKGALGAYLAAFVFLMWCGLQTSALLRGGGGGTGATGSDGAAVAAAGGEPQVRRQRELTVAGYGEDDVGPRLAYGIMVYQRVGYSPQMTLDQFARMFNALYDVENT